jgi:hypothetical protein
MDSWLRIDIAGRRVEMKMINVGPVPVTLTPETAGHRTGDDQPE